MRRQLIFIFVYFLTVGLFASPELVEEDIFWFNNLETREDGSAGEAASFERIAARLDSLRLSYNIQLLSNTDGGHSFSRNLIARIPGSHPGEIILAVPVDGGAFGIAFLLEFADYLMVNEPKHTITLTFLGAERGDSPYHPYGGRMAAAALETEDTGDSLLIYLDAENIPGRWNIRPGGNGIITPRWLIEAVTDVFSSQFVSFRLRGTDIQLARLGLQGDVSLLTPWLKADIPSIMLSGQNTVTGDDRARQTRRLRESLTNMDALLDDIPENTQSSYIYLRPLPNLLPRVVPELPYVISFLAVSAILLIVILARYRDVTLNVRRFAPQLWAWPLLMVLVFLYLFLATLFVEETLLLADFPTLWKYAPGTFVFFKLSIAAALSLNFILITRGLPLPRSPHFYSYTAILTSGLASLIFMALDITLAGYSIFTIVMLLLFTATRKIRWKSVFLIFSIIPYLMGLAVIVAEPYDILIASLLKNRIGSNIILTLILMPPILAITSLSYWRGHYKKARRNVITPSATLILSISSFITLAWILNINPYGPESPQPVELTDRINLNSGDRRLEVLSPAPIGEAVLSLEGSSYPLENLGRQAEVRTPLNRTPLKLDFNARTFLGRRTVRAEISGEEYPDSLEITLNSDSPFTVHDADFPYEQSADGTSARLFIGNHPPFPLKLGFTVNGDAELTLECVAIWKKPQAPPGISRNDLVENTSRVTGIRTPLQ